MNEHKENLKSIVLWWLGTFVALLLIIFNTIFYEMLKYSFYNRVENSLAIVANQTKDNFEPSKDKIVTIPQKLDYPISPVMIAVFGANSMKMVAKTVTFMDIPLYQYIKSNENFFIIKTKKYGKLAIYISRIISPIKGYIVVATPMYKIDIKLQDILIKMLVLNPILLFLLLLGANLIIDRILKPIKEITEVANEISVGDLDRMIPLPIQKDEIYDLVKAFNKMVARLRNGIEMMERFNSDVSHELKTPLTVLKGELEIALRKDRNCDYYKNTLQIALKEVNYLIDMVEEMLFFTKIENEISQKEVLELDKILIKTIANLKTKANNKKIDIKIQKLEEITLNSNKFLIQNIFTNIIDNAIKYTPENKSIYIYLYQTYDKVVFEVIDEGIGISKNEIDKITERFYRTEKSRNRNIKGFGLGLSIVQKALEVLDGEIIFESEIDKGLKVTIYLKK